MRKFEIICKQIKELKYYKEYLLNYKLFKELNQELTQKIIIKK